MGGFYGLKAAPAADFTAMVLVCPASETTMLKAIDEDDDADSRGDTETPGDAPPGRSEASGDDPGAKSALPAGHNALPGEAPRWDNNRLRAYFERQDSLALATRVDCPALLIHALGDEVVPFGHSLALAQHLRGNTTLLALEGGSHTTAQHDASIHSHSLAWLKGQVMRAGAGDRQATAGG